MTPCYRFLDRRVWAAEDEIYLDNSGAGNKVVSQLDGEKPMLMWKYF